MSETATNTTETGGQVHPIVMRIFSEWREIGATLGQIEAFRALMDAHKIDPAGFSVSGSDDDLYLNLKLACCAYADAYSEAHCWPWGRFDELSGWQDDVVKWLNA